MHGGAMRYQLVPPGPAHRAPWRAHPHDEDTAIAQRPQGRASSLFFLAAFRRLGGLRTTVQPCAKEAGGAQGAEVARIPSGMLRRVRLSRG